MGFFSFVKAGGKKFSSEAGKAIKAIKPKQNKTKLDKANSKLAIAIQKNKASKAQLGQTIFEMQNPKFKGKDFTFKGNKVKSESNKESYKRIQGENTKVLKGMLDKATENKKDGGRMGYKDGTKGGRKMGGGSSMSNTAVKKKFKNLGNLPETIQIKIAGKKIAKKV